MCEKIRPLTAAEVECRVAQVGKGAKGPWASILIYKDARVDMKILDETFGSMNWKRSHQLIGDRLYCTIEVWDSEKDEWISKQDVGSESNTEPEKGLASDAFKRAGFNFGIGRELYTAPKIFINLEQDEYDAERNRCKASFCVKEMSCNADRVINKLVIADSKGKTRFSFAEKGEVMSGPIDGKAFTSSDGKFQLTVGGQSWRKFAERIARDEVCEDGMPLSLKVKETFNLPDEYMKKLLDDAKNFRK